MKKKIRRVSVPIPASTLAVARKESKLYNADGGRTTMTSVLASWIEDGADGSRVSWIEDGADGSRVATEKREAALKRERDSDLIKEVRDGS